MLYLIGLGLSNEKDITVAGLEIVKKAERVYLEAYTSILMIKKEKLVCSFAHPKAVADSVRVYRRNSTVAQSSLQTEKWSSPPPTQSWSPPLPSTSPSSSSATPSGTFRPPLRSSPPLLPPPRSIPANTPERATTHTDLLLRARELSIPVRTIHNASIMNAIGACGLQLYNFGQTVSMVFFTDTWRPASFYDRVKENRDIGLHTLVLLDIKVKEQSLENMARGRRIYEPPR